MGGPAVGDLAADVAVVIVAIVIVVVADDAVVVIAIVLVVVEVVVAATVGRAAHFIHDPLAVDLDVFDPHLRAERQQPFDARLGHVELLAGDDDEAIADAFQRADQLEVFVIVVAEVVVIVEVVVVTKIVVALGGRVEQRHLAGDPVAGAGGGGVDLDDRPGVDAGVDFSARQVDELAADQQRRAIDGLDEADQLDLVRPKVVVIVGVDFASDVLAVDEHGFHFNETADGQWTVDLSAGDVDDHAVDGNGGGGLRLNLAGKFQGGVLRQRRQGEQQCAHQQQRGEQRGQAIGW